MPVGVLYTLGFPLIAQKQQMLMKGEVSWSFWGYDEPIPVRYGTVVFTYASHHDECNLDPDDNMERITLGTVKGSLFARREYIEHSPTANDRAMFFANSPLFGSEDSQRKEFAGEYITTVSAHDESLVKAGVCDPPGGGIGLVPVLAQEFNDQLVQISDKLYQQQLYAYVQSSTLTHKPVENLINVFKDFLS